jgi:hypothetical protein
LGFDLVLLTLPGDRAQLADSAFLFLWLLVIGLEAETEDFLFIFFFFLLSTRVKDESSLSSEEIQSIDKGVVVPSLLSINRTEERGLTDLCLEPKEFLAISKSLTKLTESKFPSGILTPIKLAFATI